MLTYELAHHLFEFKDGILLWKNSKHRNRNGKPCGSPSGNGYIKITIGEKQYLAHRIIYLMHHKHLPNVIDHIDGNTNNNKIENLRESDDSTNQMNSKIRSSNTSGYRNVSWNKVRRLWAVYVKVNKKSIFVGNFKDIELAGLVATEARAKYHGEFARA
ncbi:putative NHN endonuclease [uncultured Caudovirales phage]|uniref:Putative NHN endonuclease n=1 Tax=uncultured Caudovirales phage TaxID=2100421 RepID=A0A6J7WA97_9CAUD|nr:putative NHN endonuclease [uncultured Caudovirales phage]